jgi:hypothetical protein
MSLVDYKSTGSEQDYPQVLELILGLGGAKPAWLDNWPLYCRAHYNNPSCLELLALGVTMALANLMKYPALWFHQRENDFPAVGYLPPKQLRPPMVAYPITNIPWLELVTLSNLGNNLRFGRVGHPSAALLGIPMCFGLLAVKEKLYFISEPCSDVTLDQVLANPGIYRPYLKVILQYLFKLFQNRPKFRVSLKMITLRPIPLGYEGFVAYGYHLSPYIPTIWYMLDRDQRWPGHMTMEKFQDELAAYEGMSEWFAPSPTITMSSKPIWRVNDSDVKGDQLFREAGKNLTTYNLYNQVINKYLVRVKQANFVHNLTLAHATTKALLVQLAALDDPYSKALRRFLFDGDQAALKYVMSLTDQSQLSDSRPAKKTLIRSRR